VTRQRITKRAVDALKSNGSEFTIWDDAVTGFGVRVRPTGAKSYVSRLPGGRRTRSASAPL
jgi:Arm DNA-binding domain